MASKDTPWIDFLHIYRAFISTFMKFFELFIPDHGESCSAGERHALQRIAAA
jgi:hypothetical protein